MRLEGVLCAERANRNAAGGWQAASSNHIAQVAEKAMSSRPYLACPCVHPRQVPLSVAGLAWSSACLLRLLFLLLLLLSLLTVHGASLTLALTNN